MSEITALDLKKILKKATHCSRKNILLWDRIYHTTTYSDIKEQIAKYQKDEYVEDIWDCDNIALDFITQSKKRIKDAKNENATLGMLITNDHAQEIFVTNHKGYNVYYLDHRDWSIKPPDKRPRWILM